MCVYWGKGVGNYQRTGDIEELLQLLRALELGLLSLRVHVPPQQLQNGLLRTSQPSMRALSSDHY